MPPGIKPYSDYKPSGVEWLGDVPAHWEVLPGRACYYEKKVPNTGMRETTVLSLSYGQIVVKPVEQLHGLVPASFETYQIIDSGDIVIRPTDLQNDWNSLRFGLSLHCGIITSAYMCFRTKGVMLREYGHLLLHTYDTKKIFYGLGSGLRQNLNWSDFKYLLCVVPPLAEQAAIARYLDHVDGRIRRCIDDKERLVGLLEEKRRAVVHRAVTRGLDPNVRLKPSGVEWLGDVPAHWEVLALKRLGWFRSGAGFPVDEQAQQNLELPFFKVSDMNLPNNNRVMTIWNNSISRNTAARLGATVFPSRTIIFPKVGGALLTNKRRVVECPCCIDNNLMGCIVRRGNPQFVLVLLTQLDLATIVKPGPVPAISESEIREIRIAFPPIAEQAAIVAHLDKATAAIDAAVACARRQVELLREYRARLIADVVTGKLDVREAAANLPDDITAAVDLECRRQLL